MTLISMLQDTRAAFFNWSGRNARARARLDGSRAAVLNFHRVLPAERARALAVEPGMTITPESFRVVLETLVKYFRLVPLSELADCVLELRPFPPRACAITFDDGWRDNHDFAMPELKRFEVPATIFVVTDRVGTLGAFWPDEVCRRLASLPPVQASELAISLGAPSPRADAAGLVAAWKEMTEGDREAPLAALQRATPDSGDRDRELMTWSELETMHRSGIEIESHGATHALLRGLEPDRLKQELVGSREELERRGFGRHRFFAYPSGQYSPELQESVRDAGYRACFALDEGTASLASSPMAIPRLGVHQGIVQSPAHFLSKIPGWN
jgi:peptidoglycan/xylan/chitin deacetylase (PgdA/CDA1 family)